MRTTVKVTLASLALIGIAGAIAACTDARANEPAADAELKRDLELASASITLASRGVDSANLSALETKPISSPEKSRVAKRGSGTRAVRSATPTVRATPEPEPAAVTTEADALVIGALPEISEPVAVVPTPAPLPVPSPAGDYGSGGGLFGSGGGRIGGGGGGVVVIRGGGVDGDNCELHRRPRGSRGPIYVPATPTTPSGGVVNTRVRDRMGVGSRNSGTVSRRPDRVSSQPAPQSSRPARVDPRGSRRGL